MGGGKVDDVADLLLPAELDRVDELPAEDRGRGLAAVQRIGLAAAALYHGVRLLPQRREVVVLRAGLGAVDVHGQVVVLLE